MLAFFIFSRFWSLVEVKILVCEHKDMHTDITGDQTHTPLHGSPL